METTKILDADILDIVFEGRNKMYGAYQLRKSYNRRLMYSLAVMLGASLFVVVGVVMGKPGRSKLELGPVSDITIVNVESTIKPPPTLPPPPPKELPKVQIKQFVPPVITTEQVKEPPPTQSELEDVKVGDRNIAGNKSDIVEVPIEPPTGVVTAPVKQEEYEKVWTTVQIQASFPGGIDEWFRFLKRNLKQDIPVDNGAPAGDYRVVVSFLVDREGNITDVRADNDPGYGTAAEAVRVVQKSGRWNPAQQNGSKVIYRQTQPITFRVGDEQ